MARHRFIGHCTVLENLGFVPLSLCNSKIFGGSECLSLLRSSFTPFKGSFCSALAAFSWFAALQVLRTRLANIQRRILRPCGPSFQTTLGNDWNDSFLHLFPTKIDNIIRQHKPADGPLVLCPWTCRVCNFFRFF